MSLTTSDRPRVLLIVGSGRSGSTLFERALGAVSGVAALGEVVHLWDRALRDDELCACGQPFTSCTFWSAVGARAFGGWRNVAADRLVADRHTVVRTRHIPALLATSTSRRWRASRDRLAGTLSTVFAAARQESGAKLLVDSSKMPAYAALLRHVDVDVSCVQVVRDPHGVANSLAKEVQRPEVTHRADLMHRTSMVESALWWSAFDLASTALRTVGQMRLTTIRYEDFVADPVPTLVRVLEFAGMPVGPSGLDHVSSDRILLAPNHQVAGNPIRFRTGEVSVRRDDEWRRSMSPHDRRVVSALTVGLRNRHGY